MKIIIFSTFILYHNSVFLSRVIFTAQRAPYTILLRTVHILPCTVSVLTVQRFVFTVHRTHFYRAPFRGCLCATEAPPCKPPTHEYTAQACIRTRTDLYPTSRYKNRLSSTCPFGIKMGTDDKILYLALLTLVFAPKIWRKVYQSCFLLNTGMDIAKNNAPVTSVIISDGIYSPTAFVP